VFLSWHSWGNAAQVHQLGRPAVTKPVQGMVGRIQSSIAAQPRGMKQQSRALVRPANVLARKETSSGALSQGDILNGISGQGIKVH
jgi:hypothetical protein